MTLESSWTRCSFSLADIPTDGNVVVVVVVVVAVAVAVVTVVLDISMILKGLFSLC